MSKPPLGIMPKRIWIEQRCKEITDAIQRYIEAGHTIPIEWVMEYNELLLKYCRQNGDMGAKCITKEQYENLKKIGIYI
ncbi:hypothetical protein [Paenibacillus apiarius]|uniref:hypothetical protein n=1 Tax=Paenibacillus apiarius TaxID=46240 RepID=UPI003B3BD521